MTLRASALILVLLLPGAAAAQDGRGASVAGSVSATNMDAHTSWSFAGSFEYRFNRVAGLELEATAVPKLESDFPGIVYPALSSYVISGPAGSVVAPAASSPVTPTIFPGPRFENQRGRAVLLTNNVRVHMPTTTGRIDPYFVAGGGIASVRRTADLLYNPLAVITNLPPGIVIPTLPTFRQPVSDSSVDLALTIGGGVSVRAAPRLWIEGDLRLFRLLGNEDRNVGRFGIGARHRF